MTEQQVLSKEIRVRYRDPEPSLGVYANNLVVFHTDDEFVLVFYQVLPPQLWGRDPEELSDDFAVEAEPMAKIIIPIGKMDDFIKAMQTNFDRLQSKQSPDSGEEQGGS